MHPMMTHYGFSIHLNNFSGSCITVSKKDKLLALSSTEAEYLALFEASKTIMWLRQILEELGYPQPTPTMVHEDNKSTITIISNGNDRGRTKHMDLRYHYVRECSPPTTTFRNLLSIISNDSGHANQATRYQDFSFAPHSTFRQLRLCVGGVLT